MKAEPRKNKIGLSIRRAKLLEKCLGEKNKNEVEVHRIIVGEKVKSKKLNSELVEMKRKSEMGLYWQGQM